MLTLGNHGAKSGTNIFYKISYANVSNLPAQVNPLFRKVPPGGKFSVHLALATPQFSERTEHRLPTANVSVALRCAASCKQKHFFNFSVGFVLRDNLVVNEYDRNRFVELYENYFPFKLINQD